MIEKAMPWKESVQTACEDLIESNQSETDGTTRKSKGAETSSTSLCGKTELVSKIFEYVSTIGIKLFLLRIYAHNFPSL